MDEQDLVQSFTPVACYTKMLTFQLVSMRYGAAEKSSIHLSAPLTTEHKHSLILCIPESVSTGTYVFHSLLSQLKMFP